jgi:hypothetical protein
MSKPHCPRRRHIQFARRLTRRFALWIDDAFGCATAEEIFARLWEVPVPGPRAAADPGQNESLNAVGAERESRAVAGQAPVARESIGTDRRKPRGRNAQVVESWAYNGRSIR